MVVVVVVLIYPIPEDKYHIYNYVLSLIVHWQINQFIHLN